MLRCGKCYIARGIGLMLGRIQLLKRRDVAAYDNIDAGHDLLIFDAVNI